MPVTCAYFFFFNDTATTEIYTLSLHDALPICKSRSTYSALFQAIGTNWGSVDGSSFNVPDLRGRAPIGTGQGVNLTNRTVGQLIGEETHILTIDRKSTRLNSSHT